MTGEDILEWCRKQRRGLRIVRPSEDISKAYLVKAESALNMLAAANERNEPDWIVSTSYYAKYFALYSLFAKCGIKIGIHDCTIAAAQKILAKEGIMDRESCDDIEEAKALRTEMQYYAYRSYDKVAVAKQAGTAPDFVLKMRAAAEKMNSGMIEKVRMLAAGKST